MKKGKVIPLSEPCLCGHEWRNVKECLDTGWVSSVGSYVERFESDVARYAGRKYAVACASGTAALHTALMAAEVGEGDEVIMPSLTFAAPAFAVRYTGAWPVFVDVEPRHWQIDVQKTADFISRQCKVSRKGIFNRLTKRKIKAIIPVHLLGHPVDMAPLMELAGRLGLVVIEDAAESIGSQYRGRNTGSAADIACFSFNGNKIITCGGGGMLATNDPKIAKRSRHLTTQAKADGVEYIHDAIGYNYRLTNLQAAIGVAQMEKLDDFVEKKRAIAKRYDEGLRGLEGLLLPQEASWARSTFWLYTVLVNAKKYGMDSRALMKKLSGAGIQSRPLWRPLHLQGIFKGCASFQITEAVRLYKEALSLPSSMTLGRAGQSRVIGIIKNNGRI
ncbi:MAG: LegC family aminotransferase [Candidatus Omnitrophica bacterium]|nr:LegC family aminotransferase [Candidatus Omnitrophota bacterium]